MLLSLWIGHGGSALSSACWSVVAWLATYSVHAAVGAALGALGMRHRGDRPVALGAAGRHHRLWQLALWLPLLTALGSAAASGPAARLWSTLHGAPDLAVGQAATPMGDEALHAARALLMVTRTPAADWTASILSGAMVLATSLGLARFAASARRASRQLRNRQPASNPRFLQSLARMSRASSRTRVRLTESHSIDGPMVVGTSEICLPADGMAVLTEQELDAVLAHELAHVERRDGLWFPLTALLRECLWFHPLTRWVSARVAETAELACDDRAVSLLDDPSLLARALAKVAAAAAEGTRKAAGAGVNQDGSWALLPAMASPRSKLFVRVQRLAQPEGNAWTRGRPRSARSLSLAIALVGSSFALLGVSVRLAPQAEAAPATRAAAGIEAQAADAADAASLEANMKTLFFDERRVSASLSEALAATAGLGVAAEEQPAVLELRQELSHIHQMQAWLEARLAALLSSSGSPTPSPSLQPASSRPSS